MNSLLSTQQLSVNEVETILSRAQFFTKQDITWRTRATVVNLFYEPSTRTCLSFQQAAHALGLTVLDFTVERSSVQKGESLVDTLQTLDAIGVDLAIIRHQEDWPALTTGLNLRLSLINAGSGRYHHPTQALLDALTIQQSFGTLNGLKVTIIGDIFHSRVARSNAHLLKMLGATVQFAGPQQYFATDIPGIAWVDVDQAMEESDVIMMLRIQKERHVAQEYIVDYYEKYGLNDRRLKMIKKDAIILHPGPVNRNVEICDEAMTDPRCKILQQVKNGVAIRKAVIEWCLLGGHNEKLVSA
ncbi:MAG: aspartate carbamoyltransferase catalytic subunit [Firmicutes bacterium]|nr:aspartate carbamoyltransferase catalytic subunit [Bacillota bacterium]